MCSQCWNYRRGAVVYKGHFLIGPRWDPALCAWCGEEATGLPTQLGDIAPDGQNLVWQLSACQAATSRGWTTSCQKRETMPTGETTEAQSTKIQQSGRTHTKLKSASLPGSNTSTGNTTDCEWSCVPACQRG